MTRRIVLLYLCFLGASILYALYAPYVWAESYKPALQVHAREMLRVDGRVTLEESTQPMVLATQTSIPLPAPTVVSARTYTVREGDTLGGIAAQTGVSIEKLAYLNGISDWNFISVGQELVLDGDIPDVPTEDDCSQGRNVFVLLSEQKLYAREGCEVIREFVVSTGIPSRPTIPGDFRIYVKYEFADMTLYEYNLENVPWTMYYDGNYALHGKYWNSVYGTTSSSGCVNMRIPDAEWLYEWVSVGTPVHIRE